MKSLAFEPKIQCLARTADVCGEGVVFHPGHNAVYWTDINRGLIHRLLLGSNDLRTWSFEQPVTAVTLTTEPETLVVVLGGRVILWEPATDRQHSVLYALPTWPAVRCNDADVDPAGMLWIGTMQNNVAADGSTKPVVEELGELLSLRGDGSAKVWQDGVKIANTMVWSPDGKVLYFADTLRNEIYAYDFDRATHSVFGRRIFHAGFERGLPDGSAMDADGFLWNCRYGGGCIVRFAADGSIDRVIEMPVPNPTTCAFGGHDLHTLFVTSAGEGRQSGDPEDGGLFSFRTFVPGLPATPFQL